MTSYITAELIPVDANIHGDFLIDRTSPVGKAPCGNPAVLLSADMIHISPFYIKKRRQAFVCRRFAVFLLILLFWSG